jgi:hypothetical protein
MAATAEEAEMQERQQMARDFLAGRPVRGIPIWQINPMEWEMVDRLAGTPAGSYEADPVPVYRRMLENAGVCLLDQWIPTNPLSMRAAGYDAGTERKATTGADEVRVDGRLIDSPEAVAAHIEQVEIPGWRQALVDLDEDAVVSQILEREATAQAAVGPEILKAPYSFPFPTFQYSTYGYAWYFMAYALYPELIERAFSAAADYCERYNTAACRAFDIGDLPRYARLDHDMADTRGTLVRIESLEQLWFPHFARAVSPLLKAGVRAIWHCDGNLMEMVPRLLEVGLCGFQGFEYQHGMDYERICRLRTRDGEPLLIIAGVSVTSTLPHGTPADVRRELEWLVEHGPLGNTALGCSSSITPGVPWDNLQMLADGFRYYRQYGRG